MQPLPRHSQVRDPAETSSEQDQQRAIGQVTAEIMAQMATEPPRVVEVPSKEDMIAMGDALMAEMNYTPELRRKRLSWPG